MSFSRYFSTSSPGGGRTLAVCGALIDSKHLGQRLHVVGAE